MKKGCFLKTVIIGTVLIASIVYIVKYKFDDWFLNPGKKIILNEIIKNWDEELKYVYKSKQKDSLKTLLTFYIDNIKSLDEVTSLNQNSFLSEFNLVIEDSLVSEREISKLTLLLEEELNEKSKSN